MKLYKSLLIVLLFLFTTLAFPWGSELCQGCRLDSSALAGPIYTFPNSAMFQQMISTNGTFLFQDAIDRLPAYSNGIKLEIRTQSKSPLRLAYDLANYVDFSVGSSGGLTINATGGMVISSNGNVVISNGNVGIGTTNPVNKLEVNGNVGILSSNQLKFSSDLANPPYIKAIWNDNNYTGLEFHTFVAGVDTTALTLDKANGNVGIGTVSPVVALDVNGGIKIGSVNDCTADKAGTLRWYEGHISVCTGTAWRQLDNPLPPLISSISPEYGSKLGATVITINGTGFVTGVQVTIGGLSATNVTWISATQIRATTPASATSGAKDVIVTNLDTGAAVRGGGFTYYSSPTITSIAPDYGLGSGGTSITISGTDFASGVQVSVGGVVATNVTVVSATQITATVPASTTSGAKDVTVTNLDTGAGVKSGGFTYSVYATGGTITSPTISGIVYRIHTFTNTGSDTLAVTTGGNVEYLVVAGGGGGAGAQPSIVGGGGGGAGGYLEGTTNISQGNVGVVVGNGGVGAYGYEFGSNGSNSIFASLAAIGGGGGGKCYQVGLNGGSGGGSSSAGNGGSGVTGQGYAGGAGISSAGSGGGGGGASGVGYSVVSDGTPGKGGSGKSSTISGVLTFYAGGGGGGSYSGGSTGGTGGGGSGGACTNGTSGVTNSGGGGGGAGTYYNSYYSGGAGGSGIVIVRYPISQ